ncbi:electron transport complex subunit RsxG [Porticoccaceae bacterium]|nr:electron transport complex subunit RsxG [Porticoccaceae bacterium]MDB9804894.1 electron transport complex subunit RsxG [Porticoccaceae bacterium]MDB9992829.1 electron transport complex subunit RsxG [Porticoccaceae bacterium]
MIIKSMGFNSVVLALFALVTSLILATTNELTYERIEQSEREAAQRALLEIIPLERHDNDMLMDVQPVPEQFWATLGLKKGGNIHIARDQGQPVAAIIPAVTPDGYSGAISMIIGVNFNGSVAGVRVVDHRETPGLGDKVDLKKSDWILSFNGKSLVNPQASGWTVKKEGGDYDQFTGATITPRAVVKQVLKTLQYFEDDRERLLQTAAANAARENEQASL